jgi:hypothetical protein
MANDIRLDIYVSPEMYLALKHRCESEDRSMTQHVRHLIRLDLESFVSQMSKDFCGTGAGDVREAKD